MNVREMNYFLGVLSFKVTKMCMKRELWYTILEVIIMIQYTLQQAFEENNGIMTPEIAKTYGIHDSTLRKAVERKDIQRLRRGIYLLDDVYMDDLYIMQLQYSKGIYSHETAIMLHSLSTYSPFVFHISFPRGYNLMNAKAQQIRPYYVSKKEMSDEYFISMDSWDANPIRVTNLEKTIIDMLLHKEPMPGIVEEMLEEYIKREDKDINKLLDYGRRFKAYQLVKERVLPFVKSTENEELAGEKI